MALYKNLTYLFLPGPERVLSLEGGFPALRVHQELVKQFMLKYNKTIKAEKVSSQNSSGTCPAFNFCASKQHSYKYEMSVADERKIGLISTPATGI